MRGQLLSLHTGPVHPPPPFLGRSTPARTMSCSSGANSGTSTTATFVPDLASSADDTRATAVAVRRPAITTRRQGGSEARPPPPYSGGARASGIEGAKPPLVSLQCYTLGRLVDVAGHSLKFGVVRTEARPIPAHGLQPSVALHTPYGAKLAGFDRCGSDEERASQLRAETNGARPRHCLPDDSLLNPRDRDVGLSFLVANIRPMPAGGWLEIPWTRQRRASCHGSTSRERSSSRTTTWPCPSTSFCPCGKRG